MRLREVQRRIFAVSKLYAAIALVAFFAAALSAFGSWQHVSIAGFMPSTPNMGGMALACGALFLSTVTWAGLLRALGMNGRVSIAAGFLIGHVAFAAATYLPVFLSLTYVALFGILGAGLAGAVILRHVSLSLGIWTLTGLSVIPILWAAIGIVVFALQHANFFTVFYADRFVQPVILDLLHQRAYLQMIHNFGVPSVGINGLGYHNYHWLVAYPVSTLADITGLEITLVHANILPGFTGPVLIHGIAVGIVLMAKRVLTGLLAVVLCFLIYTLAVMFSATINYGLVFLAPSSAYSIALFAPMVGLFIWFLNGNLSRLRTYHFALIGGFVLVVGLAKANTMFQASILMGTLWAGFVLNRKAWVGGALWATFILLLTAGGCLYLLLEILKHGSPIVDAPERYQAAFEALPEARQAALLADVKDTLLLHPHEFDSNSSWNEFERGTFYQTPIGIGAIGISALSLCSLLGLKSVRRHRVHQVVWLMLALSLILLIQRSFFGYTTPTQVLYFALPALLVGILASAAALGDVVPKDVRIGTFGAPLKRSVLAGCALGGALLALTLVHSLTTPKVKGAASYVAATKVGINARSRELIGHLTYQRTSTLGINAAREPWPEAASNYWRSFDQVGLYRLSQRLEALADEVEGGKVAVFIPATNPYWRNIGKISDPRSLMFWIQGSAGVVLYRGKIHRRTSFKRSYTGRGISDFGSQSASQISDPNNVFCWDRFRGFVIVDHKGDEILSC